MNLREYARKRRFERTPEPDARRPRPERQRRAPRFVVQLHEARSRHYDLRLEVDGVLRSWAVPKGPSLRPQDKRLAIQVEDHPLAYADFHGDIPIGEYGAGHVAIFDSGSYDSMGDDPAAALHAGKLEFVLHGRHLRGAWLLLKARLGGDPRHWLLMKLDDAYVADCDADDLVAAPAQEIERR